MKCVYCNPVNSHGNKSIIKDTNMPFVYNCYIVRGTLYLLIPDTNAALKEKINYCPMCGRKLEVGGNEINGTQS